MPTYSQNPTYDKAFWDNVRRQTAEIKKRIQRSIQDLASETFLMSSGQVSEHQRFYKARAKLVDSLGQAFSFVSLMESGIPNSSKRASRRHKFSSELKALRRL